MAVGSNVNPNFPIPGIDQSSRGFRDNFTTIKKEIESLQGKNIQIVGGIQSDPIQIGNDDGDIILSVSGNITPGGSNLSIQYNANGTLGGSEMYFNNNRFGIGTNNPSQPLEIVGNIKITNTSVTSGILFSDGTFQTTAGGGGPAGIAEAPVDGTQYVRKNAGWQRQEDTVMVAASDETSNLFISNSAITFHMPFAMNTASIIAGLSQTSSSGSVIADVKVNGTSIFGASSNLIITAGSTTVETTSIATRNIAKLATVTVDITGAGTGAKGLKLYFNGTRS